MLHWLKPLQRRARGLPYLSTPASPRLFAAKSEQVHHENLESQQILLLPWFGARKKDVKKYQALWEQQGVPKQNIEILQPPIVDIMIPNRLDAFVEEARIRLQATVEHPLLIHSFSNGGFILSTLLLTSDLRSNMRLSSKLTKYVFDSAPAPLSPDMIARALLSVRYGNIDPLQSSLFFPLRLLCALYLEVPMIKQRHAELWQFWKNEAPVRPILCLLSKTDPLIDVQAANAFLDEQEARGCVVHRKTWESTDHVQHYRLDPKGYVQALDSFEDSFLP